MSATRVALILLHTFIVNSAIIFPAITTRLTGFLLQKASGVVAVLPTGPSTLRVIFILRTCIFLGRAFPLWDTFTIDADIIVLTETSRLAFS